MAVVNKVLVVGGGFSGMSAAIQLRKIGVEVELVEIDPDWSPLGAGITINGATLRALETLGVYPQIKAEGYVSNNVDLYTPAGHPIGQVPTPPVVGSDVAGGGGIMRPTLARILADATRAAGVRVRLGCSYSEIAQDAKGVEVAFSDGSRGRYDLVIGADGVHSKLRELLFPEVAPPKYIGQGIWRAVLPRPEKIVRPTMWVGEHLKIGVNPVSPTHMYLFAAEHRPVKEHIDRERWVGIVAELLRSFPDPLLHELVPHLSSPDANIDYRPLVNLLVPLPWNRGRVVMIGDTVHATTPHLASGAGIGIESAIVLAEELGRAGDLDAALERFQARRWERCRMVVENSARLCHIEMNGGDKDEHRQIMRESLLALTQPI
jgi:2-polyprenyl-6-methoxyphenol hydroxylase-like FAD-dependent oxidoreductase